MKSAVLASLLASSTATNAPIAKVLSMISELEAKIIGEGANAQKAYEKFAEWCEDRSMDLGFEIKTGKSEVKSLEATIAQETSIIQRLTAKVEDLANELKIDESDLKAAKEIRKRETAVFAANEKDLSETVDMLSRAILIIEREMQGGASMAQLQSARSLGQAFTVMLQASLINSADAGKLTAFLQNSLGEDDVGAPAGAVYESHSGDIIETLQDLKEKAESQLEAARGKEMADVQNFEMLKQSLDDEIKNGNKEMNEAKKGIAESTEKKSTAEGDLSVTNKELAADVEAKADLHHDCMTTAENFEAETKSRGEELKALREASKIIREATALNQVSFVQTESVSKAQLAGQHAVKVVRDLAQAQHSGALAQLAARMASVVRNDGGDDQFKKIKGLIADMIAKLEKEAEADATRKAYCDKELAESHVKRTNNEDEIERLTNKIDQMSAKSEQLKEEVATLQRELAKLAKSQLDMDTMREEEKTAYDAERAELTKGLDGIKLALKVLTEYYAKQGKAHGAADGTSSSVIGLLEVCESDFSKNLAQVESDEESAIAEYEQITKENEIEKTTKDQDVKYKTKESKQLDEDSSELSSDRDTEQKELDAVMKYLSELGAKCIDKPGTYEESVARRKAEIAGLKEALEILDTEAALIQQQSTRRTLRGSYLTVA